MNRKLHDLQQKIEQLSKEIRNNFQDALKEAAQEIFDKYPKLQEFSWIQYTPYFNDGEPCEFGVRATDEMGYVYDTYTNEPYDRACHWQTKELKEEAAVVFANKKEAEKLEKDLSEFGSLLYSFENHLQSVLGEGRVVVTRDGVEVEDYDHD